MLVGEYWSRSLNSSFITASCLPYLLMPLCLVSRKRSWVPEMKTTSPRLGFGLHDSGAGPNTLAAEFNSQKFGGDFIWYLSKKEIPGATCQPWRGKKTVIIIIKVVSWVKVRLFTSKCLVHTWLCCSGAGCSLWLHGSCCLLFVKLGTLESLWRDW